MAHALTERADGFVEFAYRATHGKGWHGLGQEVADTASIDAWREAAGMDWLALGAPVLYAAANNGMMAVQGQQVLYRNDTGAPLGVVSDSYKIVQPRDVLDFFGEMLRAGSLDMSAAGTIHGGKVFWATALIGDAAPVSVRDRIGCYLLLSTSLDGSRATEARVTSTRVVCQNTLRVAIGEGKASLKVSHRSVFDPEFFKRELGLTDNAWRNFRANMTRLANKPMELSAAEEFTARLMASAATQEAADKARETRGFAKVMALFAGDAKGSDFDGVRGTAYGLLNAVTEYTTHHVRARSDAHRFDSANWGEGDKLNTRALEALLAI